MFERYELAPKCVYLLADSLDSILAACEDLVGEHINPSQFLRLELAAITHVLQARRYLDELDAREPTLVDQCVLFLAGTATLDMEHLRSRRLLHSPAMVATTLPISDDYLIARQMPLGVLAQLTAMMLDALEAHFVLYGEADVSATLPIPDVTADHVRP